MSQIRVAMVAPPWLKLPPEGYGGIEYVVSGLVEELRKLGVYVALYTVKPTPLEADETHHLYEEEQYTHIAKPLYENIAIPLAHQLFALQDIKRKKFDIIHDHNGFIGPSLAALAEGLPPVLHTLHGPFTDDSDVKRYSAPDNRPFYSLFGLTKGVYFNAISASQMKAAPEAMLPSFACVVHNSVDIRPFRFQAEKEDYFCTLARFAPYKGQAVAAKLCGELGVPLRMAGIIGSDISERRELEKALKAGATPENPELVYFGEQIVPIMEKADVQYVGNLSGPEKVDHLANARALLFPIDWEEPFGVAVIEALACGTPVIAMNRGAMPEIIQHGYNGYLANNESEFKHYMTQLHKIDSQNCRDSVVANFSSQAMAKKYVDCYRKIIAHYKTA